MTKCDRNAITKIKSMCSIEINFDLLNANVIDRQIHVKLLNHNLSDVPFNQIKYIQLVFE